MLHLNHVEKVLYIRLLGGSPNIVRRLAVIIMTNINITTSPSGASIEALRTNVAQAVASSYGAMREYAQALCGSLPVEWYLVEHADSSDTAKPVHAEKKALFVELKKANHSNPSTIWARVRKYGQEYIEGVNAPAQTGEAGEGEAAEGGNTRETRSLTRRFVDELTLLYKAGKRAESLSDKESEALTKIGGALIALGVDLSML